MRISIVVSFSVLAMACVGSASPEKCEKVAEHVVRLSLKSAVGDAADASGSTDELIATAAAKIASAEAHNSPQFKKIQEGCQKVPESIADCMLAATSDADLGACRPKQLWVGPSRVARRPDVTAHRSAGSLTSTTHKTSA